MIIYRDELRPLLQTYVSSYEKVFPDSNPKNDWKKRSARLFHSEVTKKVRKDTLLTAEELYELLQVFEQLPPEEETSIIVKLDGPLSQPKWRTLLAMIEKSPQKRSLVFSHLFSDKRSLENRLRLFLDEFDNDAFNSVGSEIEKGTQSVSPSPLFGLPTTLLMFAYPDRYISYQFGWFRKFFESYSDYEVQNASNADLVSQYMELDVGVHQLKQELESILEPCDMIDVRNIIRHHDQIEEYIQNTGIVTRKSSGNESETEANTADSDKPAPNPLAEYYEAFRSVRNALEAVIEYSESEIDPGNDRHPAVQYYLLLDGIISTSGIDGSLSFVGYGPQQADRSSISMSDYRQTYGNGEWIQDYRQISVAPFQQTSQKMLNELDLVSFPELHVRPIAPDSDVPIPEIIETSTELRDVINLLTQFPAYPATPSDQDGDGHLPAVKLYSKLATELPDDATIDEDAIARRQSGTGTAASVTLPSTQRAESNKKGSTEEWDIETLAGATELDESDIQESVDHLIQKGCHQEEAIAYVRWYLKDMLRGDGMFAVSGVGPNSGYKLTQAGISTIDELQGADPDEIAELTDLSAERVKRLQTAAEAGDLRYLDPDNKEVANRLLESESTRSIDTTLGRHDAGNTNQRSSDSEKNGTEELSGPSDSNTGNTDRQEAGSESIITRSEAKNLLQSSVGSDAEFRDQQWQTIDALANKKEQLLLVQRTGWGKSTVYFIATYALREQGAGPTLIISPLLSLMRDQIKNAEEELGLSATTVNSKNESEWGRIYEDIIEGECDIVLISPERLKNQEFREQVLSEMADGFGMLVVDEAHCISDWGHDFRPDYQRVTRILERLPSNVPVAATTATANDRVVDDITTQLPGLRPIRGNLVRKSLQIQAINMGSRQERLAWLAENLPEGKRAGIIYCLTIEDVQRVTEWLQKHGYDVESYHGSVDDEQRRKREQLLLDNKVDALVATNALGMGFDKPDLKFVIHFQRPPNLIRYYQEIGRAGRDLDQAHAVVLSGPDDDDTAEYFIESAFPSENDFEAILSAIEKVEEPLTRWDIRKQSNASNVEQCLKMLQVEGAIKRTDDGFVRTANEWSYDADKYAKITAQRYEELDRIQTFMRTDRCLTLFIDEELDGVMTESCGRCANCSGDFYPRTIQNKELVQKAVEHYQESGIDTISNRVYRYEKDGTRQKIPKEHRLESGRSLAVYDEPGWGTKVREGKYETGRFDDDLVHGAAELIEGEWNPSPAPQWITFVPSESTEGLIADYAGRLADELNLELIDCVRKTGDTKPQKELSGSFEKCANVRNAFSVTSAVRDSPVLLVDDIVQSKWTLTEVGRQLSQAGSGNVYPFALAKRRG